MTQTQAYNPPKIAVGTPRQRNVISLTPLIDVVFILLVFFMLASSFLDWRAIAMDTSKSSSAITQSTKQAWTLRVDGDQLSLNQEPVSVEALLANLKFEKDKDPELAVRIQPIGNTSLQSIVVVLDELKENGFNKLNFVRDPDWEDGANP